ncbi:PIG-L deacetylase family protein [Duganella violaceipulchra]|uniref:LmbE family N-acetylglucosaminyl deacetylase n=1 Tax=Duganella violaceipulchra TaxID=2849652 RepID=A0AA41L6P6_9BURK|nr:PIG-L family deacetylase [Duganella violaceicalia]MBV6320425.1 PIG-L family deacetylase [Duganella violaceicalia]MCP2012260.1 LmbE family N-acetylglucosaminyl deacetylase [Duganella violaceicalia]
MPTDRTPPAALFLFAHQDDEFGVFQAIEDCRRQGWRVVCAYLTHGAHGSAARRNDESLAVLAALGVPAADVLFAGDTLDIVDATLPRRLDAAGAWLAGHMAALPRLQLVCAPAWEGGHHDHDALHFLAVHTAARLGLGRQLRQYALYHAHRCPAPWFRVLSPLAANGAPQTSAIGWRDRLRHLRLCLRYPSQLTTWIGLFPFVLAHYLLQGRQALQQATPARTAERPHAGPLYYERRRFYRWEQLQADTSAWLRAQPATQDHHDH